MANISSMQDRTVLRQLRQDALSDRFRTHRRPSNRPRRERRTQRLAHSWSRWMRVQYGFRQKERFAVGASGGDRRKMRNARKRERAL